MTTIIPPKITFYGGVGFVTGANFLFEADGKRVLIDCGMLQGVAHAGESNKSDFAYDPASIDVLIVTHAHIDHIGRIPKLVHDGFLGTIISTAPTHEISVISLEDNFSIMMEKSQQAEEEPWYNKEDIQTALSLWKVQSYHHQFQISENLSCSFYDAGHILGSAMAKFSYHGTNILFTGDLGNTPTLLLRDTEILTDIDYMVMESVYGNRNHEQRSQRSAIFEKIIEDTLHANGTLVIPSFSIERTQELLFELNTLIEGGHIPEVVPVFVDSPLAISVTEIYKNSTEFFKESVRDQINAGDDVFKFNGLRMTRDVQDSKAINDVSGSKIILAGSGMLEGGRILHHLRRYISDPASTILFVGYQAPGTLGRVIVDGARYVTLFGESLPVRARIAMISGYSGHKQMDDLVEFVSTMRDRLKGVWCAMGETDSSLFLAQRLRDYLGVVAMVPNQDETVTLAINDK